LYVNFEKVEGLQFYGYCRSKSLGWRYSLRCIKIIAMTRVRKCVEREAKNAKMNKNVQK